MKQKHVLLRIIIIILIMISIFVAFHITFIISSNHAEADAEQILKDDNIQQTRILDSVFGGDFSLLESFGAEMAVNEKIDIDDVIIKLRAITYKSCFDKMGYCDLKGNLYNDEGDVLEVDDKIHYMNALSGSRSVTSTVEYGDEVLIVLSVPIKKNGAIIGTVVGAYFEDRLRERLISEAYSGQGRSCIINSSGDIVVNGEDGGFDFNLHEIEFLDGYTGEEFMRRLRAVSSGSFSFTAGGVKYFAAFSSIRYEPIYGDAWHLFSIIPEQVIKHEVIRTVKSELVLGLFILLAAAIVSVLFIFTEIKNSRKIMRDASKLRLSEEEFRIAALQSNMSIFRYDVSNRKIYKHSDATEMFKELAEITTPEELISEKRIAESSEDVFRGFFAEMEKGEKHGSGEVQMMLSGDSLRWYHGEFTMTYDADGTPYQAIVSFYDCTEQREKQIAFLRWQQELAEMPKDKTTVFEWNLTKDTSEGDSGARADIVRELPARTFDERTEEYSKKFVNTAELENYKNAMNREKLLGAFHDGVTHNDFEYRETQPGGRLKWMRMTIRLIQRPGSNDVCAYIIMRDIDEEKREEIERIERAERDSLTTAFNRDAFIARAEKLISEKSLLGHAFIMLDIDGFKGVNDTFGHGMGDSVLSGLVRSIRSVLRQGDIIGRMGGDEFMILLSDIPYDGAIEKKAQQICEMTRRKLSDEIVISVSLGISVFPRDGVSFDVLYKKADEALYYTKDNGKDGYSFYRDEMKRDGSVERKAVITGAEEASLPKKRMLVVDDQESSRLLLEEIFKNDYTVIMAKDGAGALSQLERYGTSITVMLLDIYMPETDGFAVLAKMREDVVLAGIPTIMISSDTSHAVYLDAIAAGASDYATKPFEPQELKIKVKNAVTRLESERERIQMGYLRLQGAEEERYRRVLSATGTVVFSYDWVNNVWIYDSLAGKYLGGRYDKRSLGRIFADDGIAAMSDIEKMEGLMRGVIKNDNSSGNGMEIRLKTPSGEIHWFKIQVIRMSGGHELTEKLLVTFNDANDEIIAGEKLRFAADYDALTGLYNRECFIRKSTELIMSNPAGTFAIVYMDVAKFKALNDTFGRDAGDRLLKSIALISRSFLGEEVVCARVSSDHFTFCARYGDELFEEFKKKFTSNVRQNGVSAEIILNFGIYIADDLSVSISDMIDRAMIAEGTIKDSYTRRYAFYTEKMRVQLLDEQHITGMMHSALATGEFEMYLQPQYNHGTKKLVGAEALARWNSATEKSISPARFIPIFEKNGFIFKLDAFIWESACKYIKKRIDSGLEPIPVSVNVSRYDLLDDEFSNVVTGLVKKYGIPVKLLRLEVTETAFANLHSEIIEKVVELRKLGFIIEIDDFGSGYSSLNTLKDVPADVLKLDMRFFSGQDDSGRGGVIIASVARMARWLEMPMIAEGVETDEQADYLLGIGCDCIQGYLYAKPMPVCEFEHFISSFEIGDKNNKKYSVAQFNSNAFWNPSSQETLMFNSFFGAVSILRYHNGKIEVLRINQKYTAAIAPQLTEAEIMKIDPFDVMTEEARPAVIAEIEKAIETGEERTYMTRRKYPKSDSDVWVNTHFVPIAKDENGTIMYCSLENITDKVNAEKEADEATEQLRFTSNITAELLLNKDSREAINHVLEILSEYYGAMRAHIFKYTDDGKNVIRNYKFISENADSERGGMDKFAVEKFDFWTRVFKTQEIIYISDTESLGEKRHDERDFLKKQRVKSLLAVPLRERGADIVGYISIDNPTKNIAHMRYLVSLGGYLAAYIIKNEKDGV